MPQIYIVEDDENIKELILYALRNNNFSCIGFNNYLTFFNHMKKNLPELIILDSMLPKKNGMEILGILKSDNSYKNIPIIFLTAKGNENDKLLAFEKGAVDYIVKPFSVLELIARVKVWLKYSEKNVEIENNIISYKNLYLDENTRKIIIDDIEIFLTYKEFEILKYLLINKGIVLSREKILNKVWGFKYMGETRTVDVHIKTLRSKLKNYGDFIKTIRGVGYKIGD